MRRLLPAILIIALSSCSSGKKIELIHVDGANRISVVTKRYAYDFMTTAEFKKMFGIEIKVTP